MPVTGFKHIYRDFSLLNLSINSYFTICFNKMFYQVDYLCKLKIQNEILNGFKDHFDEKRKLLFTKLMIHMKDALDPYL